MRSHPGDFRNFEIFKLPILPPLSAAVYTIQIFYKLNF